ncbi:hypothetical protein KSS87_021611, partial [Heliosperma pusillum]
MFRMRSSPPLSMRLLPNYIVSESEVEASKEGRRLVDFRQLLVDKRPAVHSAPAHVHIRE